MPHCSNKNEGRTWKRCSTSSTTGSARRWSPGGSSREPANELYGHPDSPLSYLPGSRNVAAAFDLMTRLTQRYERPEFGIDTVASAGASYAVREVYELDKPFCRLLHFVKEARRSSRRVLVFAPLSGHYATLLRDTVRALLADHDVWITDWIDAREIPITVGPVPLRRLRGATCASSSRHVGPDVPRDLGVPADRAGARRRLAHGRRRARRSRARSP